MQKPVMVVDDSVTIRTIADLVFRKTEFELITASSAVEALARLNEVTPEMIIVDAEMPGVDGYALAKRLRENEKTAEIMVLLMVTDAGPDPVRLGDTDIDGYVVKPFSSSELLDPVRMLTGAEVRHDVPLSFEQIMAARHAAEEQRRIEIEAMLAEKKRSDEDELDFNMDDDRAAPPSRLPPPPSSNAAADLDLPPPAPPPSPLRARPMDIELKIEAPISSRSNTPIPPVPTPAPLAPPAPLKPPVGGPIGEPEPVEEPEQHVTSQAVEQPPPPPPADDKTPPPGSHQIHKAETGDMVVEHVASTAREPEMRKTPPVEHLITIPPQLRPRPYGALFVGVLIIVILLIVWLRY